MQRATPTNGAHHLDIRRSGITFAPCRRRPVAARQIKQTILEEKEASMALFLDPVSGLLSLQRELERAFQNPFGLDLGVSGRGVFPLVNIFSERDGYVIRLEIPGVAPADLHIEGQGRSLTVKGRREPRGPEGASFHRRERDSGEFSRSLQLPDSLDPTRAEASYKDGILTIRVPKREEMKPRQITVKAT
jgi:HSP20 family protein